MKIIITESQHNKLNSYLRRIYGFMMDYLNENFSQEDICDSPYSDEEWDGENLGDKTQYFIERNLESIIYYIAIEMVKLEGKELSYTTIYENIYLVQKLFNDGDYIQHIKDYFNEALENC
jgi:hypothetical protein